MFYFAVLTYNRANSLQAHVKSILDLKFPAGADFKIFIFDNASAPAHRERFQRSSFFHHPKIVYTYSPVNTYMRGKCHLEDMVSEDWKDQQNCFLVHLDDDVQLTESWLLNAWTVLQNNGLDACGSVVELNGKTFFMGQQSLDLIDENVEGMPVLVWDWHWQSVPESVAYSRVEFAGHMALLVRMEAAARVRHDPRMLAGGDDIDYSLALRKAGFSIGIAHRAKMVHRGLHEQDAEGFRTFDRVLSSWRCFYNKWGFVRRSACFEARVTSQEWLRLVIQPQAAPAQAGLGVKPGFGP